MKLLDRLSVQKLYDDLEYWQMIGIADDIIDLPKHRPEYCHLVVKYKDYCTYKEVIALVLNDLRQELKLKWYKRKTFWILVGLYFKRILHII